MAFFVLLHLFETIKAKETIIDTHVKNVDQIHDDYDYLNCLEKVELATVQRKYCMIPIEFISH